LFATNFSSEIISSKDFGKNWEKLDFLAKDTSILCLFATNDFPSTLYIGTTSGIYKLEVE